jgi:poly-gamma-glutamate biosynthesis protein PgsC/CapC
MTYETLLIGILVAVAYTEIMEIYPGGIIVPGYMALYLDHPLRVLTTIAIAFLSLATYRLLSRHLILYGKRRFVTLVLIGALWAALWQIATPNVISDPIDLRAVGWLIPGLLANNLEKQRTVPTLASLATVAVMTYFVVRIIMWF